MMPERMKRRPGVYVAGRYSSLRKLRLAHDNLTYDDLVRIVELIKSAEQFSEFRLKIGEIEVRVHHQHAFG